MRVRDHAAEWVAHGPRDDVERAQGRARSRALTRLSHMHPVDFAIIYHAEMQKEALLRVQPADVGDPAQEAQA